MLVCKKHTTQPTEMTVYCLVNGKYGKPDIYELHVETQVKLLPDIVIQWGELAGSLPVDN